MQRQGSKPLELARCSLLLCALIGGITVFPERAVADPAVVCAASCSSAQSCTFNGITNIALGNATLSVNGSCNLVVSNIGPSGQDGVSQVSLPSDAGEVVTLFACPNFAQSQAGDKETVTVHANVPGGIYYTKTIENLGNETLEVRPDFSSVGATLYTVTVLNGDIVTGVFRDLPSANFVTPQGDQREFN